MVCIYESICHYKLKENSLFFVFHFKSDHFQQNKIPDSIFFHLIQMNISYHIISI